MYFISVEFLSFLACFCGLYFMLPKAKRYVLLGLGNIFFYCFGNVSYLLLILFITILAYGGGLLERKNRKFFLFLPFAALVLLLAYFKYLGFITTNLNFVLRRIFGRELFVYSPVLPIGLSFCVFQSIGYLADVYRKNIPAEKNILRLCSFLVFFPTLLCGPIQKARILLPQIKNPKGFNSENAIKGFYFFVWGMFEKIIVADNVRIIVNDLYAQQSSFPTLLAIFFFSVYIYADFCAYSDMARGVAKFLGFEVGRNFLNPYFSASVAEFWRRWHVSLNEWFVENVYIPLGGSRNGKLKKYLNVLIVFFISGIWHGAAWHYAAWGVINGILVVLHDAFKPVTVKVESALRVSEEIESIRYLKRICVFVIISFTWVFFRNGFRESFVLLKSLFTTPFNFNFSVLKSAIPVDVNKYLLIAEFFLFAYIQSKRTDENSCYRFVTRQPVIIQGLCIAVILVTVIFTLSRAVYLGDNIDAGSQFIYFSF